MSLEPLAGLAIKVVIVGWKELVPLSRLKTALVLFDMKRSANQEVDELDCTQLCDLGHIVRKDSELRLKLFGEPMSQRQLGYNFRKIEDLRNMLAHSQKIEQEWKLVLNLMKMVRTVLEQCS